MTRCRLPCRDPGRRALPSLAGTAGPACPVQGCVYVLARSVRACLEYQIEGMLCYLAQKAERPHECTPVIGRTCAGRAALLSDRPYTELRGRPSRLSVAKRWIGLQRFKGSTGGTLCFQVKQHSRPGNQPILETTRDKAAQQHLVITIAL
ncbi:hypothetical protein Bbelb_105060 [Branchiostoma belcheri]|nr:hypothetical protein Bbelb_105060 [Branchiostoma belcheri]